MYYEVAVATYAGDISTVLSSCSLALTFIPFGRQGVKKFGAAIREGSEYYLLMVSQSETPVPDYNVIVTVFGSEQRRSREIMADFQRRIGIEAKPAPEYLVVRMDLFLILSSNYTKTYSFAKSNKRKRIRQSLFQR